MAICARCGRKYTPSLAKEEYKNDSFINRNKLEDTYGNHINRCADCAVEEAMDTSLKEG